MKEQNGRIAVLDGVRAFSILLIMGFHLWQQSWLQYLIPSDLLRPLGIAHFSLMWVPRTGYMFVDVLLLLSGFCLFLPYARQMTDPLSPAPDSPGLFFKKRAARILPTYYLCLLMYLVFWIRPADYPSFPHYLQDVLSHLTFTHTFWPESYIGTKFPTTLWTLGIEVQFYLIFPVFARIFRRFPLQSWAALCILSEVYLTCFARLPDGTADALRINQFPAFFGVYANGMLAAVLFCRLRARIGRGTRQTALLSTLISFTAFVSLVCMLQDGLDHAAYIQRWQVDFRFWFSALICVFLLALDHACRPLQWIFSNRAVVFISAISYNLYLWHATVLLQLKAWHIPPYPDAPEGVTAWPQSAGSEGWHFAWQVQYTVLFWIVSFLLAALLTCLVEKPAAKRIFKHKDKKQPSESP
ncbi:MAG: acyltransferase family protein [Hominenteromicrobium sp.]